VAEAATVLRVSRQYVYALIHAGKVPAHRYFGVFYMRRSEMAAVGKSATMVGQRGTLHVVDSTR
jgi:excisionase family DNA binding protein